MKLLTCDKTSPLTRYDNADLSKLDLPCPACGHTDNLDSVLINAADGRWLQQCFGCYTTWDHFGNLEPTPELWGTL